MCYKNILLGNLQKLLILLRGPKQLQITIWECINLLTLSLKSFLKAFCFSFYYRVHNNNYKKTKWNLHCSYYPSSQAVKYFWNSQCNQVETHLVRFFPVLFYSLEKKIICSTCLVIFIVVHHVFVCSPSSFWCHLDIMS